MTRFTVKEMDIIKTVVDKCDGKFREAFDLTPWMIDDLHHALEDARTAHGNFRRELERLYMAYLREEKNAEEKLIAFIAVNREDIADDFIRIMEDINKIKSITNYSKVILAADVTLFDLNRIMNEILNIEV